MDVRAEIATERELTIKVHDVDDEGGCGGCGATGVVVEYPCDVRLFAELAADALMRRKVK